MNELTYARELVNKIYQPLGHLKCKVSSAEMWEYSKSRATEWVDEIIKNIEITTEHCDLEFNDRMEVNSDYDYLTRVKHEISKL